ncbi:Mur ligase [Pseudoxanthomonas winnipegensis]|jgi:cyanophycin synthetase|uniref:Mur ligase n=1 Tax=Pseudoxanthomonas winnipegensis TaxID=2480810 RepID=A0ABY1WD12_9GAMM|nr:Mur ligase family protein [Pseudoxanthomonas winnipegensis]TAA12371.1 Mur ligase [Pseudoxanthomonas winnipegensis]TAA19264.1 Mur ligase [Pseudoxanthomonas winnipegensis]TAH70524.1 Mur ligase [Pseudoxanthomonas winnipegensis]
MQALPYRHARRLTGPNVYFADTGTALESAAGQAFDLDALRRWDALVREAVARLGWPAGARYRHRHASGATLAFSAPLDQLHTATALNIWAWWIASNSPAEPLHAPGDAATWDIEQAMRTLQASAAAEAQPTLLALQRKARARALPFLLDEDELTLGSGSGARSWFVDELPDPAQVPWPRLHRIPTALVTGSNGKTTTTRLLAALCQAHAGDTAYCCTDGVFFQGQALDSGDFSGPSGAREALRQGQARAAVLETARGGLLRHGLAVEQADVAVVTNVAHDHFGEFGVHDLHMLAQVKLSVARAVGVGAHLVLNADDAFLRTQSTALSCPLAWFALDFDQPLLRLHRALGKPTCGVRDARLWLALAGVEHDLGPTAAMPLSLGDRARYNLGNLAAGALAGALLGISPATIARVLSHFGQDPDDNPGRLQQWMFGSTRVVVDYAHNPEGLRSLLDALDASRRDGRLALLLGHAGNRQDEDLRAVAHVAAAYAPERVMLKELPGYARGREADSVPALMHAQLLADGLDPQRVQLQPDEVQAARSLLAWASEGDLLVLPVHELANRAQVVALLDEMVASGWRAGAPVPEQALDRVG